MILVRVGVGYIKTKYSTVVVVLLQRQAPFLEHEEEGFLSLLTAAQLQQVQSWCSICVQ